MASLIRNRSGAWELRESRRTLDGPRSRTLATFHRLSPEVVAHAQARASHPLDPRELRRLAARAGAPVAASPPDRAAAELLRELDAGHRPRPALARLLAEALGAQASQATPSDSARAAAPWVAATSRERGETLRDLLLLGDRLPRRSLPRASPLPRIESRPA
jgi:hypothetical protein